MAASTAPGKLLAVLLAALSLWTLVLAIRSFADGTAFSGVFNLVVALGLGGLAVVNWRRQPAPRGDRRRP